MPEKAKAKAKSSSSNSQLITEPDGLTGIEQAELLEGEAKRLEAAADVLEGPEET